MNLALRRNYWLIVVFVITIVACFAIGSTRIIAYNFGEGQSIEAPNIGYDNDIYLYDDSVMHEISINLTPEQYDEMVTTYQETGEKEYYQTNVTIDGVTVPSVGVRLKGNLTLRQTLGGQGNGQDPGGQRPADGVGGQNHPIQGFAPPGMELPGNWNEMDMEDRQAFIAENGMNMRPRQNLPEGWEDMTEEERQATMQEMGNQMPIGGPMGGGMNGEGNGNNPPFLIKTDAFIDGQSYQGFTEISVRIGSDASLLAEPIAYYIHKEIGQIVPETSYAVVTTADNEASLYVLCEHLNESYVEKYFPESEDGILYKSGNFVGFEYLGDDPTLYAQKYEQKTNNNDDDLAPLIRFLKFVDKSSDEQFEQELGNWLDIDSFVRIMALDNLLANNDSFVGMGSNYFLYYDKASKKCTMLSWDLNLAMGSMGGGNRPANDQADNENDQRRQEIMQEWLEEGGFGNADQNNADNQQKPNGPGHNSTNTLRDRFMANEKFSSLYNTEYSRLQKLIFNQSWALEKVENLAQIFTDYNSEHQIMEQSEYDSGGEKIKNFLTSTSDTAEQI